MSNTVRVPRRLARWFLVNLSIAAVLCALTGRYQDPWLWAYVATVASIAATCLLIWLVLRSARWVSRRLGSEGINVITRLTGFLLICIGVQFVASGVRSFVAGT